ncbi:unnamed protein product, partial [Didymodactylos carnosus]
NERGLTIGRNMLSQLSSIHDTIVLNAALHMFMSCADTTTAEQLFNRIKTKDIASFGAMMKGYNMNNDSFKVLTLFERLIEDEIEPDIITFVLVINACAQIGMISCCRSVISRIPKQFLLDKYCQNALIDMWGKAGSLEEAQRIFQTIDKPDVVSFGAMINAFGLNGMGSSAVDLYRRMPVDMRNEIIHICVLNACSHSGLIEEARSIFRDLSPKTTKITTAMVDCMSRMRIFDEAQKLIDDFEQFNDPYPWPLCPELVISAIPICRRSSLTG